MKKVLILAGLALTGLSAAAQSSKVNSAENNLILQRYDAAKSDIDEALQNEKSSDEPNTYLVASKIYLTLAAHNKADEGIAKAKEYFIKAKELDAQGGPKGKKVGKAAKKIEKARAEYRDLTESIAGQSFNDKNYSKSLDAFLACEWFENQAAEQVADTALYSNIGIVSMQAENWAVGAPYFLKTARLYAQTAGKESDGSMAYLRAKYCYEQLKDSVNVEGTLKEAFEAYPQVSDVINTLINYYLQAHKNDEALVYLNNAIQKDPNNAQYFFARGCLNESTSFEDAKADYEKAISLDPKHFGATYNLAIVYYNAGLKIKQDASAERDINKYNAMMKEANESFAKSVPFFEGAAQIAPDKKNKLEVLTNLKRITYILEMFEKNKEVTQQIAEIEAAN